MSNLFPVFRHSHFTSFVKCLICNTPSFLNGLKQSQFKPLFCQFYCWRSIISDLHLKHETNWTTAQILCLFLNERQTWILRFKKTNFDQWCSSRAHFQAHTDFLFFYMVLICLIIARKTRSLDFHNIDQTFSFCENVKFCKFEVLCLLFRGRTRVVLPAPSLFDTPAFWGLPLHWKHRVYKGVYHPHTPSAQANKPPLGPVTALGGNSKTNQAYKWYINEFWKNWL